MGDPPSDPAVKSTEILVSPDVRDNILGASGVEVVEGVEGVGDVGVVTNRIVIS